MNVDPSTVRQVLALFDSTGTVNAKPNPDHQANSCRKLSEIDQIFVLELVLERPGVYLREIQWELVARGTVVHESTICRGLQQCGFTRTKLKLVVAQRSEDLQAKYVAEISIYKREMLVFVDEMGSDRRKTIRKFGYS